MPATTDEIEQLEMGGISEEIIKFVSPDTLNLETATNAADRILWDNRRYKVLRKKENKHFGFTRYFAALEDPNQ